MQSPPFAEADNVQICSRRGPPDNEHATFVDLHIAPFQRHLLQLHRNRRVRLLSGPEFDHRDSEWHGEHGMINGSDPEWSITMHYMGDISDFFRRLRVVKAFLGSYNVYHNGQRWVYLVNIDFYTTEDAQAMLLQTVTHPLLRAPPPPAPAVIQGVLVPADAQVQEPQQANRLQEWELW